MGQNAVTALHAAAFSRAQQRDLLLASFPHVIAAAAVPGTTLAPITTLLVAGQTFLYDATDTTSAHDGEAVLVSEEGRRYKLTSPAGWPVVIEAQQDSPPVSPDLGLTWIVGGAPTGAWASHADDLATWTANGWRFIAADNLIGWFVLDRSTDSVVQMTDAGWRDGLGASAISPGSVNGKHFVIGLQPRFSVENQTTNAPPGSPSDGVAYIIGPSPTGAWASKQTQIASREGGAWAYYVPAAGWRVYDKALGYDVIWGGSGWVDPLAGQQTIPRHASAYVSVAATVAATSSTVYTYSATPPTKSQKRSELSSLDVTMSATAASKKLLFEWELAGSAPTSGNIVAFGIFRDAETTAMAWAGPTTRRVFALSDDAASHVYRLAVFGDADYPSLPLQRNASLTLMQVP